MGLFQAIKQHWSTQTTLPAIADEIAERCLDAVWNRVQFQVTTLAPAESRGYIRARGVAVVQRQLASDAARHDIPGRLQPQLYAMTVEAVIQRIHGRVRDNASQPQLRRAA